MVERCSGPPAADGRQGQRSAQQNHKRFKNTNGEKRYPRGKRKIRSILQTDRKKVKLREPRGERAGGRMTLFPLRKGADLKPCWTGPGEFQGKKQTGHRRWRNSRKALFKDALKSRLNSKEFRKGEAGTRNTRCKQPMRRGSEISVGVGGGRGPGGSLMQNGGERAVKWFKNCRKIRAVRVHEERNGEKRRSLPRGTSFEREKGGGRERKEG